LLHGSIINRFLAEVRDAAVQVVPVETYDRTPPPKDGIDLDEHDLS